MTETTSTRVWPAWSQENDGYRGLASYVSPRAIEGLGLTVEDTDVGRGATAMARRDERLRKLWNKLVKAGYTYRGGLRIADGRQRVKDPSTVHHSSGNCLEVSAMFAALCLHTGLRAHLVVLRENRGGRGDHAAVLVDLNVAAHDTRPVLPEPCVEVDDPLERHVYQRALEAGDRLPTGVLVMDVVQALSDGRRPAAGDLAKACSTGADMFLDHQGYRSVRVVDVVALHADGYPPLAPQPDDDRPAIYPSLPALPDHAEYSSRTGLLERLSTMRGRVVLYGESGLGKSTLAAQVARHADDGSGWFLNASSTSTLAAALATAELVLCPVRFAGVVRRLG